MADYDYVVSTGVIVPDTADTLADVQGEYRAALGADLPVDANTPQGVLITAEALARDAVARNNADLANQINPNLAGGIFLDAIWALTGGGRTRASRSVILGATLAGVAGTIVPAGAQASAGTDLFETVSETIIPGVVDFQAVEYGPIAVAPGALSTIVTSVLGWETVTNSAAALIGRNEETDQASRTRRRNTLALQGVSLPEAILSAVWSVEGVRSAVLRENVTGGSITIDGQTLVEHSIYVAVDGGTDLAVATVLLANKSLGCNWNGTTTVNVTEPTSQQVYAVKFQRPAAITVYVRVTARSDSSVSDPSAVIKQAVVDYSNGVLSDEPGFVIGADVSPWEISGAINRVDPPIYVTNIELSTDGTSYSNASIPINIAQVARTTIGSVSVVLV